MIDELTHGHDLDHLVATRLHPNRIAVGFRLLARTLAIGYQLHHAEGPPPVIREPLAFRAAHVEGLGLFYRQPAALILRPLQPMAPQTWTLAWTHQCIRLVA